MAKVALKDATQADLAHFCEMNNLDVRRNASRDKLLDAIAAAFPGTDEIEAASPAPAPAASAAKAVKGEFAGQPRYEITVAKSDKPDAPKTVPVGVNGHMIRIRRGERVVISESHYKALCDGVIRRPVINGDDGSLTGETDDTPRYSVQLHRVIQPGA